MERFCIVPDAAGIVYDLSILLEYIIYSGMFFVLWLVLQLVLFPIKQTLMEVRLLVESKADRDRLTGFWNQFAMWDALALAVAKPLDLPISIIFIDLDNFKNLMREYGQDVTDKLVADVAQMIWGIVDRRDFVCRYDREQFVIVLLNIDGPTAQQKAEVIRGHIAQIRDNEYPDIKITASLGVCDIRGLLERTPKAIFSAVQEATYMAKRAGRNRVFRGDAFIRKFPPPPKGYSS
jgi:diguanylate cyclase (GGDEF)-like protein